MYVNEIFLLKNAESMAKMKSCKPIRILRKNYVFYTII